MDIATAAGCKETAEGFVWHVCVGSKTCCMPRRDPKWRNKEDRGGRNTALLCLGQLQACCSQHREEGRAAHAKTRVCRLKCSQNTLYIKPNCSISCALFQPQGNAASRAVSEQCYALDKSCRFLRSWWAVLCWSPRRDVRKIVVRPKCFPAEVRYEARF